MNRTLHNKAVSTFEYIVFITIFLIAFLFMQKYFVRGYAGRMKDAGDSFGMGWQYNEEVTIECEMGPFDNSWYSAAGDEPGNYRKCYRKCYKYCMLHNPVYGEGPCGGFSGFTPVKCRKCYKGKMQDCIYCCEECCACMATDCPAL